MNPGYITMIVILIIIILLVSGWKDYFLKGLNYGSVLMFIGFWLGSSMIKLEFSINHIYIHLNVAFIFLLVCSGYLVVCSNMKSLLELLNLITGALIIALLNYTFKEVLILNHMYTAICLAIAVAGLQKSTIRQLICLFSGLISSDTVSIFIQQNQQVFTIANQNSQDLWWLTLLFSRLIAAVYENGSIQIRKWYGNFLAKK